MIKEKTARNPRIPNFAYARSSAFTLAEIMVTLSMLGVLATITIGALYVNAQNRILATRALKTYATLEHATAVWQAQNHCSNNISKCILKYKGKGTTSAFNDIARNLEVVASSSVTCNYKQSVEQQQAAGTCKKNLNWLPDKTTLYDNRSQTRSWEGVSNTSNISTDGSWSGEDATTGLYLLKDGTTISVQMPDNAALSGFGFFDVNGKKGPNTIGKDVYPFGWGMPYSNADEKAQNEALFGDYANNFNPYYNEDSKDWWQRIQGINLCVAGYGTKMYNNATGDNANNKCSDDSKYNPTAYLLKHRKIPNR